MNIIYLGKRAHRRSELINRHGSFIAIGWDKWDDYNYKTMLPCYFIANGQEIEIPNIRILIEECKFTAEALDGLVSNGWNGYFPIPNCLYVSVPSDITFYQIISGKLGQVAAIQAAQQLNDASYAEHINKNEASIRIINSEGFNSSLLREARSRQAYMDGWVQFSETSMLGVRDFQLNIPKRGGGTLPIEFRFNSKTLPYDINILIGPNGIGKSFCLQTLVEYWLRIGRGSPEELEKVGAAAFDSYPNINSLILVSYSPFEEFTIDLEDTSLSDKDAYHYFGFRVKITEDGRDKIQISRNLPAWDSARSIIRCIREDQRLGYIKQWINKFDAVLSVLKEAITFDDIALSVNVSIDLKTDKISNFSDKTLLKLALEDNEVRYVKLVNESMDFVASEESEDVFDLHKGVVFIKDGEVVNLSSGQRLFSYIVINILGALRYNSLVVVDEPELFLHPNLEITFLSLLKSVLRRFNSKAILATHSLVSVREVPANCVHVLRQTEFGIDVARPPFETFGGDIQRISSYVFGDKSISKPYQDWLGQKMAEYENPEDLIKALGPEINEELIIKIHSAMGKKTW